MLILERVGPGSSQPFLPRDCSTQAIVLGYNAHTLWIMSMNLPKFIILFEIQLYPTDFRKSSQRLFPTQAPAHLSFLRNRRLSRSTCHLGSQSCASHPVYFIPRPKREFLKMSFSYDRRSSI